MENEALNRELVTEDYIGMFILLFPLFVMFAVFAFYVIEIIYIRNFKKPILVFPFPAYNKLANNQINFLEQNFSFYRSLKPKYQKHFQHRVSVFINHYQFIGNGINITDEMKICIASTYVQLTFGMRKYLNDYIVKILIYPDIYFSEITKEYHKGEFNPRLKTIVFSWKHFYEGLLVDNDNLNLGLHEFTHALHFMSLKSNNHTLVLFQESLQNLFNIISKTEIRKKLLESGFLREYAYENQFEFVAVLLEYFFESNKEFKQKFPSIYDKVKQMINYNENYFV